MAERNAAARLGRAIERHRRPGLAPLFARLGLGPYRGYFEMLEAVAALVRRGASLSEIGASALGEPIFALRLGGEGPTGRRTSVVLAALHPTEWVGIETALALASRLTGQDLGGRQVVVVPVANPDGVLRVEENLRAGRRRLSRHNARGVDLQRNFDARWGEATLPTRLLPALYAPGSHAASEPETQAIVHTLSGLRIDRAVSIHGAGESVLFPPAHSLWPSLDAAEHATWASRVARAAGPRYRASSHVASARGLTHAGLELDWLHDRHGALSLLVRPGRSARGLFPRRWLEPFAWQNPKRPDQVATDVASALLPFVAGAKP